MQTILLVQVDPATTARLREAAGGEVAIEEATGPAAAVERLEHGVDGLVLAVLGETLEEPVRLAQQIAVRNRLASVMLLTEARRCDQLRQAIQFAPFLSSTVTCQVTDAPDRLVEAFRETLDRAGRQRRYERMMHAARARLQQTPPPRQTSALYLDRLLDHAPIGVVIVDAEGRIRAWNRHAGVIFDLNERQAMNRRLASLFPEAEHNRLHSFLADHREAPHDAPPETFVRAGARAVLQYLDVTATSVEGRDEEPGTMVLFQDVTQRVVAEQETRRLSQEVAVAAALAQQAEQLRHLNQELELRNRELQEFAYVASHDLQEPLRKIRAFADLLDSDYRHVIDDEGRLYLHRVQDAAGRMSELLSALLEYSRVSTRARAFAPVDLNRTATEVTADLEILSGDVSGRIEVGRLPTVEGDPVQMRQLFQNLIGNGLKFHRKDAPPIVRVEGALERNGTAEAVCRIEVSDNGIGFDEKYADRIFAPFERLHTRERFAGTGMGLAICRRIVERHHGTIEARSRKDEGSTFVVRLPVRQPRD